jgi:hypothetical protein
VEVLVSFYLNELPQGLVMGNHLGLEFPAIPAVCKAREGRQGCEDIQGRRVRHGLGKIGDIAGVLVPKTIYAFDVGLGEILDGFLSYWRSFRLQQGVEGGILDLGIAEEADGLGGFQPHTRLWILEQGEEIGIADLRVAEKADGLGGFLPHAKIWILEQGEEGGFANFGVAEKVDFLGGSPSHTVIWVLEQGEKSSITDLGVAEKADGFDGF